ncbi:MAG: hypothetical protein DWQ37_23695 [Planctomycetota bacterium]|nr:MAG: hypothetical protein DWQ37_23695 [Planctomycetota bacterium]
MATDTVTLHVSDVDPIPKETPKEVLDLIRKLNEVDVTSVAGRREWNRIAGGDGVVLPGGPIIYSSGSRREHDPEGLYLPPPADNHARGTLLLARAEYCLNRATLALRNFYAEAQRPARDGVCDPATLDRARELRAEVDRCKREHRLARNYVDRSSPDYLTPDQRKERARVEAIQRARVDKFVQQLDDICNV